jgi:hypothetical protein
MGKNRIFKYCFAAFQAPKSYKIVLKKSSFAGLDRMKNATYDKEEI